MLASQRIVARTNAHHGGVFSVKSSLDGHNLDKSNGLPTNYRNDSNGGKLSRLITGAEGEKSF